jgi:hypothetical protein
LKKIDNCSIIKKPWYLDPYVESNPDSWGRRQKEEGKGKEEFQAVLKGFKKAAKRG